MEGKFAKIATAVGIIAGIISIWQFIPSKHPNYSGEWILSVTIEHAASTVYTGSTVEWKLHVTQSGDGLSGSGEKIAVNSMDLDFKDRTRLTLNGTMKGNEFTINYIEKGKLRETSGLFLGRFERNEFNGSFSQTASDSRGRIQGHINKKN